MMDHYGRLSGLMGAGRNYGRLWDRAGSHCGSLGDLQLAGGPRGCGSLWGNYGRFAGNMAAERHVGG